MHGRQMGKILIPNGSLQPVRIWFFLVRSRNSIVYGAARVLQLRWFLGSIRALGPEAFGPLN
jgi:hypothetical protein